MEFIGFLDKGEVEIIKMVEKAGYKIRENTNLCLISENYVGFFNSKNKQMCTNSINQ